MLPVAGRPWYGPSWVPVHCTRDTTFALRHQFLNLAMIVAEGRQHRGDELLHAGKALMRKTRVVLDEICRDNAVGGGRLVFVEHLLNVAADEHLVRLRVGLGGRSPRPYREARQVR